MHVVDENSSCEWYVRTVLSRRLAMIALAVASLATTACADLTRPNEITIKAEPAQPAAGANREAPTPPPGAAAPAPMPAAPGGGG